MAFSSADLDVLTINLWGDNGPARARMAALSRWLRSERPDLVLLQEVEHVDGREQCGLLASAAGYEHVHAVRSGAGVAAGEGLGVLSAHPLQPRPTVCLPQAPHDPARALQQADVATAAGPVRVANTHLAWRLDAAPARAAQASAIVEALTTADTPAVLGGDLNDVPGSEPLARLEAAGFVDCCSRGADVTFDLGNAFMWQEDLAGRRVDHVLARGLDLSDARVVLDGSEGPVVSDHYGVRVTLRFRAVPNPVPGYAS